MLPSAAKRQRYLFACFVLASYLGATYGGPIDVAREKGLIYIARQATTTTQTASTAVQTSTTRTSSRSTTVSTTTSSAVTSTTSSSTSTASTTSSSSTTSTSSDTSATSTTSSATSTTSSTSSSTSTSTTASASATSSSSSSILSKSSPYFGYAVGVLVVVSLFGLLLIVLIIRFIVQKFGKKPEPQQPLTPKAGAWRYSQDTELYSPGTRNQSVNPAGLGARHKDIGSEMGEREAFLSTESVALYPAAKEDRYTDDDATHQRHSRSISDSSQATATPFVSRRPGSMAFLHSPPATHPTFVVDQVSQSAHSQEHALGAVPEAPQEREPGPRSMPSLLMARAARSDAFRQQTSSTGVSRAASTASAYSQPSAIRTDTPPLPVLLSAFATPESEIAPDVSTALSTLQAQNPSTDTIHTNEFGATDPPTTESHSGEQPTLRQTPGRLAVGGQAPTSIHSHADLFFDHSHSR